MNKIGIKRHIFTFALVFLLTLILVACDTGPTDQEIVEEAVEALSIGFASGDSASSVTQKVTLPPSVGEVAITWTSSNLEAVALSGDVTRIYHEDQQVRLTATLKLNEAEETKIFDVIVKQLIDSIPPAFMGAISGQLPSVTHLQTVEVNLLEGIVARDNVDGFDVTITVDTNDYDKDVAGEYTVTYTAEDKSGNQTSINRLIVVQEALDATLNAAVIGDDWVEFAFNDPLALEAAGTFGATFRQQDKLHVMDKAFFAAQLLEHASDYPNNNGIPVFPYGSLIITDKDFNIIHVRLQTGVYLQLDVVSGETVLTHTDVAWNQANTGIAGGSLFTGVEALIPEDGFVMFASSVDAQKARIFLVSNLFHSGYTGGATVRDNQDVFDITNIELKLEEDYRVLILLPDKIATPELVLNRHTLSWNAIPNALNYTLYVNGEIYTTLTTTSIDLSTLELEISEDDGYLITVKANTTDMFKFSSSDVSESILYKKVEIQTLAAPVVTVEEGSKVLTWAHVEGTDTYEVYFRLGTIIQLVATVSETSFDVADFTDFNGVNGYFVKGIGLATHSDSANSNVVFVDQTVLTRMSFGGMETDVVIATALDYFNRRNETGNSKPGNYLYLVTGIDQITSWTAPYNEAFSTVVILNSELEAKVVRNILGRQTYTKEQGWFDDTVYATNGAQTLGFSSYVESGDMLLIGKNGLNVTFEDSGETLTATARDFLAYHFVNPWATFPATPASGGWRDALGANYDSSSTVVEFVLAE